MSLPSFPTSENVPSREEVINQIISSIAMEELGLSHIINAEGEKIQYALGTIPGVSGLEVPLTMDQLLELNKSVRSTLDSTMMNQFFMKEKLTNALSAGVLTGPTGPTGPQGPATIAISPDVIPLEPEFAPTVDNLGDTTNVLLQFGIPRGATGATGATGAVEAEGIQIILSSPGAAERSLEQDELFPFDLVESISGSNITYDTATRTVTVNTSELNNMVLINWWALVEGRDTGEPTTISLNANGVSYPITLPWPQRQVWGSTLVVVAPGVNSFDINLTNVSEGAVGLATADIQAQMNVIGFRNV